MGAGILVGNRYQLEELIGRGGMGQVHRAKDQVTGATVAIKRLSVQDGVDLDQLRRRFAREIQTTRQFHHPHIVRTLDSGEDSTGLFLVMELVEAPSLTSLLANGARLEWERAVTLGKQLCSALKVIHAQSIIHRDLKTSNVLITQAGTPNERAVLIDFGISLSMGQLTQLTSSGMVVGTAEYCAPEQIAGLIVDQRADLYAFGVLLFRMVAGVMPFEGPEVPRIIYAHLHTPAPKVRLFSSTVPDDLEAVIARCLSKDPSERYPSAGELEAALGQVLHTSNFAAAPTDGSRAFGTAGLPKSSDSGLTVEAMLEFKDLDDLGLPPPPPGPGATFAPERQRVYLSPSRILLQLSGELSVEHRALALLSWVARLAPFFEESHITLQRARRLLERALTELVKLRGNTVLTVKNGALLLNGQKVDLALEADDFAESLALFLDKRGIAGLRFELPPSQADLALLVQVLRTGSAQGLDGLATLRVQFRPDAVARTRPPNPITAWERVMTGMTRLILEASHGLPFDSLGALEMADIVVAEASRPGRRLLGIAGSFAGTDSLAAQASNAAFLASCMALDLGLSAARIRDVAHLAIATSVGVIQVYPLAFADTRRLSEEERSLLRQTPISVIRQTLAESVAGPAVWRRLVLAYELSLEMARGLSEPLGRGELPEFPPSNATRLVFAAMTYWGLRAPRAPLRATSADEILATMRGPMRQRLDPVAVKSLETVIADAELGRVEVDVPGAEAAVIGWSPAPHTRRIAEVQNDVWGPLATLMHSLVSTGLESKQRILPLLLPVIDTLVMQDEFGLLNGFVRQLRTRDGGADSLETSLARDLLEHLTKEECLALLTQVLNDRPPRDPREFGRTLSMLEDDKVPQLLKLFEGVTLPESTALILEALVFKARQDSTVIVNTIKTAPEAKAVELIGVLARARDRNTLPLVQQWWPKAAPRSKAKLLEAVAKLGSAESLGLISKVLADDSPQLRSIAISCLGTTQVPQAVTILLDLFNAPNFAERPVIERQAVIEALATRPEAAGVARLEAMAQLKPPLLNRSKFNDERRVLVNSLARVGGLRSLQLLQTLAQDTRQAAEVRTLAQQCADKAKQVLSRPSGAPADR